MHSYKLHTAYLGDQYKNRQGIKITLFNRLIIEVINCDESQKSILFAFFETRKL